MKTRQDDPLRPAIAPCHDGEIAHNNMAEHSGGRRIDSRSIAMVTAEDDRHSRCYSIICARLLLKM